jgi:replication factor A1
MEIKDVKPNQGNIEVTATVVEKEEPRSFSKFGKSGKVCNAKIKDKSGEIKLTLWNEDVEKINVGDKIKIENGWCSEYKSERQLSTGKFGKIEVMEVGTTIKEIAKEDKAPAKSARPSDSAKSFSSASSSSVKRSSKSSSAGKDKGKKEVFTNDPTLLQQKGSDLGDLEDEEEGSEDGEGGSEDDLIEDEEEFVE